MLEIFLDVYKRQALGFELRHLFRRIVVLLQDSGEHILKGFQSLFVHHVLRYFSAATPDFIQASTSLILNFHLSLIHI